MSNTTTKMRLLILLMAGITIANLYWLLAAALDEFRDVNALRASIGAFIEGVGIRMLIRRISTLNESGRISSLFLASTVLFGASMIWYGLLHGNEARVSPSIWQKK